MAKLSMECKKLMVNEIGGRLNAVDTLIVTNYIGINSQNMNELRRQLRGISGEYIVVKNSMAKRALSVGSNGPIADFIKNETGVAINNPEEDPTRIAGILTRFSKDHQELKIYGGIMNGAVLSMEDIKTLAALPPRKELLGVLANVLNAPIQGLAGGLNAIITKLLYALNAIKDKKEASGGKAEILETKAEAGEAPEKVKGDAPLVHAENHGEKREEEKESNITQGGRDG